jgi:hypothetical protein
MQIDRYNHLLFPREANSGNSNNQAATGKDVSSSAAGTSGVLAKPRAGVPATAVARVTQRPESVVLNIQWPDGDIANTPDPGVYTNGRKAVTTVGTDADTGTMARDHQLAVDRNAGTFTQISLNKDDVLVANKAQSAATQDKQPDFVALAVSAMREYSDEHDRQKVRSTTETAAAAAAPTETHWSAFKGLQQIAAKLNVFA